MYKIGHSKDTHRFEKNRKLILGGVEIDYEYGLLGHSDADCLIHAIVEALIGAMGLGDIGTHFPDNNLVYKDISSTFFLTETKKLLEKNNYEICNIDSTIFIEEPLIKGYYPMMKKNIASFLNIKEELVNIKATRGEGLGFVGRKEGVVAEAVVLIKRKNVYKKL